MYLKKRKDARVLSDCVWLVGPAPVAGREFIAAFY